MAQGPEQSVNTAKIEAIIRELDPQGLEGIPKNIKPRVIALVAQVTQSVSRFSGPIPPPDVLQGYENVSPGFANRVFTMAGNAVRS